MKYRTIVADPPWQQRNSPKSKDVPKDTPGARVLPNGRVVVVKSQPLPYPTMSVEDICALPVPDLYHPEGVNVFLWTTNIRMGDALRVLEAWRIPPTWGTCCSQILVWKKLNPSHFAGVGSFAPMDVEFVLVGRRGSAPFSGRAASSVFEARRSDTNSRKPDVFLDMVEQISPGPYLELFARRQRLGWDTWGNEALEHVEVTA